MKEYTFENNQSFRELDEMFNKHSNEYNEMMARIMTESGGEFTSLNEMLMIPNWLVNMLNEGDPVTIGSIAVGFVFASWAVKYGIDSVIEFIKVNDKNSSIVVAVGVFSIIMLMSQGVAWTMKFWLIFIAVISGVNLLKQINTKKEDDDRPITERVKQVGLRVIQGGKR